MDAKQLVSTISSHIKDGMMGFLRPTINITIGDINIHDNYVLMEQPKTKVVHLGKVNLPPPKCQPLNIEILKEAMEKRPS